MFRCNLPPALFAEWLGSFTCHCGNTGVEQTMNESQHTKSTLEKKILLLILPGFEHPTFWSQVRCCYKQVTLLPETSGLICHQPVHKWCKYWTEYRVPLSAPQLASCLRSFWSDHCVVLCWLVECTLTWTLQLGAVHAEIKVPSGENTELKRTPFRAWSRSVYSHACYAYCQGFLLCLFLPSRSTHQHLFQNLSQFFSCVGCG